MPKPQTEHSPIHIKADRDGDRPVVLRPEDDDIFVRTGRQVIEACRLGISVEIWLSELRSMLEELQQWCRSHLTVVKACFCAARGTRTVLFFIPSAEKFDFELADELTRLNSQLVQRFNIGPIEILQVPMQELDRFLTLDSAKHVYGEHPEPHPAVEA